MFCQKCGSLMLQKGANEMQCSRCKHIMQGKIAVVSSEKKIPTEKRRFDVVDSAQNESLPKTKAKCFKCGNEEAYYWEMQTRAADEPATRFFKCTKCKNVWRDYS